MYSLLSLNQSAIILAADLKAPINVRYFDICRASLSVKLCTGFSPFASCITKPFIPFSALLALSPVCLMPLLAFLPASPKTPSFERKVSSLPIKVSIALVAVLLSAAICIFNSSIVRAIDRPPLIQALALWLWLIFFLIYSYKVFHPSSGFFLFDLNFFSLFRFRFNFITEVIWLLGVISCGWFKFTHSPKSIM